MSRLGNLGGKLYRGEISFDFVGRQRVWYTISGIILVVSVAALLINGLKPGVEFKGGSLFTFRAPHATEAQIQRTVQGAGAQEAVTQKVSGGQWRVQTESLSSNKVNDVQKAVADKYHLGSPDSVNPQIIGPSWGKEITNKAVEGLVIFLVLVVVYLSVAFEWRMAFSAIVALLHDILITVGIYALVGIEVTPASVIGLLTILGYSLYDTVVVFDKVRENTAGLLGSSRRTYSEAANLAVNQTLVRSINTSVMALLPVVAILIVSALFLGGGTLEDLALVLFIGMLAGTYSSIFVATPLLADLKERQPQFQTLAKRVAARRRSGKAGRRAETSENDEELIDAEAETEEAAGEPEEDVVAASSAPSSAGQPRPRRTAAQGGPRNQPRRGTRRRPGGGRKRR